MRELLLVLALALIACGTDQQPRASSPAPDPEPEPAPPADEPFRPLVLDGPAASWTDVNTDWWPNGLRPVARQRLDEIERATYVEAGAAEPELRWLHTPMVSSNVDPTWTRWEAEHRMHSGGPAERIDGRVVWLNLPHIRDYEEHRPLLNDLVGPVAFHFSADLRDEWIRRRVREHSERYETGINIEGSAVTNDFVEFAADLPGLRALFIWHSSVDDEGLAPLRQQTELRELRLFGTTSITDAALAHLSGLTKMRGLDLGMTQVTDAGLRHLREMRHLELLDLGNTRVTVQAMATIGGMRSLRDLGIGGLQVADGLPELGNLSLERLEIAHIGASDADLEYVATHRELEFLDIRLNDLTDAALAHLSGLTKLRMLHLGRNARITDRGLTHLRGLSELRILTVAHTGITRAGVEQLKRQLPNLAVSFVQI